MVRTSLLTAFGTLALAATTFAAPAAPAKVAEAWASGRIERVDVAARSVVVKQGTHEMTFALASDAHLMQGKKTLQPDDLTGDIGRHVKVRYTVKDGTKIADRLDVSNGAAKTPSAANQARK